MLSATLSGGFPTITVAPGAAPQTIDLSTHVSDPAVTGTAVQVVTNQGTFDRGLDDAKTPVTVANFLHYVNSGEYDGTVLQRAVPGFILQGGGFTPDQNHIATAAPVANEAGVSNTSGTIAMALSNNSQGQVDPNSATSDWFINIANNAATLDPSKFTAFGNVLYNGMTVVNTIVSLPKGELGPNFLPAQGDPTDGVLPLQNYNAGSPVLPANYVTITSASVVPALTYHITSDNPTLVGTSVSGKTLSLTYGPGTGVAHVTVAATDLANHTVTTTFTVGVGVQQASIGGKGAPRLLRFTDPNGASSQITVNGPGTATALFGGTSLTTTTKGNVLTLTGTPTSVTVSTAGTNAHSTLTIQGRGGNGTVTLAGLSSDGALRAINGRNTVLNGSLSITGSVGTLTLSGASGGTISIGAGGATNLRIGSGGNEGVVSASAIKSLSANSWDAGGSISAPSISRASIKGAFAANVTSASLTSFAAGSISGGSWNVSGTAARVSAKSISNWTGNFGTLGRMTVNGTMDTSAVHAANSITSFSAVTLTDSNVLAGMGVLTLPTSASQFINTSASIGTVRVSKSFQGSNFAAAGLGRISLGTIQVANAGTPFGIAAHTIIKSITANASGKHLHLANVTTEAQASAALLSFAAQDFTIGII